MRKQKTQRPCWPTFAKEAPPVPDDFLDKAERDQGELHSESFQPNSVGAVSKPLTPDDDLFDEMLSKSP